MSLRRWFGLFLLLLTLITSAVVLLPQSPWARHFDADSFFWFVIGFVVGAILFNLLEEDEQ